MSKLPAVAIIGRPNTGKSTLFNRIVGRRKAIVSDVPGTTRDHISHRIDMESVSFLLIDTGGIGATRDKDFEEDVKEQSLMALEFADVIVFTVNSQQDITADDRKILELLRKKRRRHVPVIVALTKADTPGEDDEVMADFQEVNIGEAFLSLSSVHKFGVDELLEEIEKQLLKLHFKREEKIEVPEPVSMDDGSEEYEAPAYFPSGTPSIAIIGRPNVGKSSIVNALMSDADRERSPLLVSPIAGTTRDSIDTEVTYNGQQYTLIDTAGLRKNARRDDEIERFSAMRTLTSIERADIVILVLDASEQPSQQDKRIAAMAVESGKGLLILLNKIDTMKGEKRKQALEYVSVALHFCSKFVKIIPCSAKTREGLVKLFDMVESIQLSRTRRLTTRQLHRWFEQAVHGQPLGEVAKIKHLTQANEIPPTFVLFVKNPKRIQTSHLRFLENRLRETFGFDGTPIRFITKSTEKEDR
jgi:GTP-binding protein